MGWFFSQAINEALQDNFPDWLITIFKGITFLGDSIVYIVILAIGFWIYKKRDAIIGMYVLLTSAFLNFFLKVVIQKPRPTKSIRMPEDIEGFSTPSGHAQASTTVYGWIMFYFKKVWLYIVIPILVLLICLSRVVLGVHYIGDVILGFLIGAAVLAALYFAIPYLLKWIDKWSTRTKILVGEAFGIGVLLLTFLTGLFANWAPEDLTYPVYYDDSAHITSALILLPFLVWLEAKFVKMKNENIDLLSKFLRIVVGLVVLLGSYFGLSALFGLINTTSLGHYSQYSVDYLLRFIRYSLLFVIAVLPLPLLFARVKIFSREKVLIDKTELDERSAKS
ncbi:MAG: phosphatase PAP2 family protein [Candidatus Heimdallarchaeota archaeon]|nr:phosphatase PAP2 family protein [Candidatus Heimdallarchaeota archaeon]MBY8995953.1 phosphatase PAP2 family protein [Candidatus Heimdallarchaeota archaeon]